MSKQIQAISFVAFVARILPAEPSKPQKHWSYRLIDGRKCWYEGENNFPKSLLQWPEQNSALSAFGKSEPSPEEELLPPVTQPVSPHTEPNNPSDSLSFEARWRALGMNPVRN